jgi:hypothetical protein
MSHIPKSHIVHGFGTFAGSDCPLIWALSDTPIGYPPQIWLVYTELDRGSDPPDKMLSIAEIWGIVFAHNCDDAGSIPVLMSDDDARRFPIGVSIVIAHTAPDPLCISLPLILKGLFDRETLEKSLVTIHPYTRVGRVSINGFFCLASEYGQDIFSLGERRDIVVYAPANGTDPLI